MSIVRSHRFKPEYAVLPQSELAQHLGAVDLGDAPLPSIPAGLGSVGGEDVQMRQFHQMARCGSWADLRASLRAQARAI